MKTWRVELVTNYNSCNIIEIEAVIIRKKDYQTLFVDGVKWDVPDLLGMSFAEIEQVND